MSSDKSSEEPQKYSAYDHIKKQVAEKSTGKTAASPPGTPLVIKVFFISVILFGGLLFSGALTGPGPFSSKDNGPNRDTGFFDEGTDNSVALSSICVQHSSLSAHYHYDLSIFIDGVKQTVPANIGIESSSCYRPIHTHDASGHVHVELPTDYSGSSPTLGDFFSIWGYPLSTVKLLDHTGTVTMSVNSQVKSGNIQFYVPSDGDQIVLQLSS